VTKHLFVIYAKYSPMLVLYTMMQYEFLDLSQVNNTVGFSLITHHTMLDSSPQHSLWI